MEEGRLLEVGACARKYGEFFLSALMYIIMYTTIIRCTRISISIMSIPLLFSPTSTSLVSRNTDNQRCSLSKDIDSCIYPKPKIMLTFTLTLLLQNRKHRLRLKRDS